MAVYRAVTGMETPFGTYNAVRITAAYAIQYWYPPKGRRFYYFTACGGGGGGGYNSTAGVVAGAGGGGAMCWRWPAFIDSLGKNAHCDYLQIFCYPGGVATGLGATVSGNNGTNGEPTAVYMHGPRNNYSLFHDDIGKTHSFSKARLIYCDGGKGGSGSSPYAGGNGGDVIYDSLHYQYNSYPNAQGGLGGASAGADGAVGGYNSIADGTGLSFPLVCGIDQNQVGDVDINNSHQNYWFGPKTALFRGIALPGGGGGAGNTGGANGGNGGDRGVNQHTSDLGNDYSPGEYDWLSLDSSKDNLLFGDYTIFPDMPDSGRTAQAGKTNSPDVSGGGNSWRSSHNTNTATVKANMGCGGQGGSDGDARGGRGQDGGDGFVVIEWFESEYCDYELYGGAVF